MIYTFFQMIFIWIRTGLFYYSPQRKWISTFPDFSSLIESVSRRVLDSILAP